MKNRGYIFLVLIFLVCILCISAVSAADDSVSEINTNDNQEIILEESTGEDVSTDTADNQEQNLAENDNGDVAPSAGDNKEIGEEKTETKVVSKKTMEKPKNTVKASSKKKTTFKTISKGSKDKAMVKKIQKALKKNGYYLKYKGHKLKVDGRYGFYTFRSVKQFQKAKKLKVTGNVDEETAEKLKLIDRSNAVIKLKNYKTFKGEYNSGKSFVAKIVNKSTKKGIETILRVDYFKKGKKVGNEWYYYTDANGINYITPDELGTGTYTAKISCEEPNIKAYAKTKTIKISKTSIRLKTENAKVSDNQNVQLKASLKFKNNAKVNEGKVKFTINGKSYIVKVKKGLAIKNLKLKNIKSNKYKVKFLGTKNIKVKSATGKIG